MAGHEVRRPYKQGIAMCFLPKEYGGGGLSNVDVIFAAEEPCAVDPGFACFLRLFNASLRPSTMRESDTVESRSDGWGLIPPQVGVSAGRGQGVLKSTGPSVPVARVPGARRALPKKRRRGATRFQRLAVPGICVA
jgi:hypothetical protein